MPRRSAARLLDPGFVREEGGGEGDLVLVRKKRSVDMPMMEAMPNFVEGVHHCIALLGALSSFLQTFFLPCPFRPFPFFGRMSIQRPRARAGREGGCFCTLGLLFCTGVREAGRGSRWRERERGQRTDGPKRSRQVDVGQWYSATLGRGSEQKGVSNLCCRAQG